MSANLLREAATLMRERAEAAMDLREYHRGVAKMGRLTPKGQHAAFMSPPVALAVADWLDAEAGRVESAEASLSRTFDGETFYAADPAALKVAETYLGRSE